MTRRVAEVALAGLGLLACVGEARAEWVMTGTGRHLAALPMTETFDSEGYIPELVWVDDAIATFSHQPGGGYQGSGAPQFDFVPHTGEDNTGLAYIFFPPSAGGVRHVSVRWLMLHGAGYFGGGGSKALILKRCNDGCTDDGPSGQRGMVMENAVVGSWDPYISENIEASGDEPIEPGKVPFDASSRPDEWISYEAEFDLDAGVARLFIDTLDGEQDSAAGTAPYKVWTEWEATNGFNYLDWLTGYWEAHPDAGPDAYFRVDELVIDTSYIGPPADFRDPGGGGGGATSTSIASSAASTGGSSSAVGGAGGGGAGSGVAASSGTTGGASGATDEGGDGGCAVGTTTSRPLSVIGLLLLLLVRRLGRSRQCPAPRTSR